MKVLMINTVPTEKNGITNVIRNLCSAMDQTALQLDLMAINVPEEAYAAAVRSWGGRVWTIPRSIRHPLRYMTALSRKIRQEGYDAVHIHGNSATLVLELFAAKWAGCGVRIVHSHNTSCLHKRLNTLLQPVFRRLCTHRLACSEAAGQWLYGNRPFQVVRNGVDTLRFSYDPGNRCRIRQTYGIPNETIVIGHVGLFTEIKNQGFLLELLAKLPSHYHAMLVGEGPDREKIQNLAAAMGLEARVHLTGAVDTPEAYYSAFDIMTLPSLFEGLPLTLVEAQSSGLRCLVSDAVTQEADLTGNMVFLPIGQGPEPWLREILNTEPMDREAVSAQARACICLHGFDISTEAAKMKEYYRMAAGRQ